MTVPPNLQQHDELRESIDPGPFMPAALAGLERSCATVLSRAGCPNKAFLPGDDRPRVFHPLPDLVIGRGHPVGSRVWFAAETLVRIAELRKAITLAKLDDIVFFSIRLGMLVEAKDVHKLWGRAVASSVKKAEALSQTNKENQAFAQKNHSEWQAAADALRSENPKRYRSNRAAAQKLAEKFPGTKANTIRRAIVKK